MNKMGEPLIRASTKHTNWEQKEIKIWKEYMKTCEQGKEKMDHLTGL